MQIPMALARDDYHTRGEAATQRGKHFVEQIEMRQMISLQNKFYRAPRAR